MDTHSSHRALDSIHPSLPRLRESLHHLWSPCPFLCSVNLSSPYCPIPFPPSISSFNARPLPTATSYSSRRPPLTPANSTRFDPLTRSKIHILPPSPSQSFAVLSKHIDPSNIPKAYGGQLDWRFGDQPSLDQGLLDHFGIRQEEWKIGPGAINQVGEIVALGRTGGKVRREVVGRRRGGGSTNGETK